MTTKELVTDISNILLYTTEDNHQRLEVVLNDNTVWLSQRQLAELYQTTSQNITMHIRNIYADRELEEPATCKEFLQVQPEGVRKVSRSLMYYNLEMILSIGYRVRSQRGVQFRQWATESLQEYIIKGFLLDDERLKGSNRVTDYFDELLARIRDIRASEARVYQRIREIFALATDYRSGSREAQAFFAAMQNKMHFAATGHTAAEIVQSRADAGKPNMGLTTWKGSRVQKADVITAKNYLDEKEIDILNRIVVMFLDQAEFRVLRRQEINMGDWKMYLDKFLQDNELPVLTTSGSVSHEQAQQIAKTRYAAYADKRLQETEEAAEKNYLNDLRSSVKAVAAKRRKE